jgi:thiol-disulfide isomerase/thioredoxin
MLKIIKFSITTISLLFITASFAQAKPALDFTLSDSRGADVSLSQFKGKIVYLDFWASWCSPCLDSFPWMDRMQKKYRNRNVVFLAINLDKKRKDAEKFLSNNPVSFAIAFDSDGKSAKAYQLEGMPSAVIVDKSGEIRHTHIGFNLKNAKVYEAHIQQLLSETQD